MHPMKLVLLVLLAPLWLPHYLALMGVGFLIKRSMEWPATPTTDSKARAERFSVALGTSDQPSAEPAQLDVPGGDPEMLQAGRGHHRRHVRSARSIGYRLRLSD